MERLRRPAPLVARRRTALTTALSFVNCTKYPPSLQFLLMTLGPALLALAAFDRGAGALGQAARDARAGAAVLLPAPVVCDPRTWPWRVALARGEPTGWLFIDTFPIQPPPSSAFGLAAVYGWWLVVLALLYVPCAWFAALQKAASGIVLAGKRGRRGTRFSLIAGASH